MDCLSTSRVASTIFGSHGTGRSIDLKSISNGMNDPESELEVCLDAAQNSTMKAEQAAIP